MAMSLSKVVEEVNKKDIIAEQYKQKYLKDGKEVIRLTEYIEELKHFHTIYSAGDTDGDMAEELMVYEHLIKWLEELKHRRESEYPYIVDFADVNNDKEGE